MWCIPFVPQGSRTFRRQTFVPCYFRPLNFSPQNISFPNILSQEFPSPDLFKVFVRLRQVTLGLVNLDQINKPQYFYAPLKSWFCQNKMHKICCEKFGDESAGDQNYKEQNFLGTKYSGPKFRDQNSWRRNVLQLSLTSQRGTKYVSYLRTVLPMPQWPM